MKFNTFLCLPRLCSSWLDFFANSSHSPLLLVTHSESHLLSASSLDIPSTLLSHSLFTCCSLLKKAFPWLLFGELHLIPSLRLKCHLFREEMLHILSSGLQPCLLSSLYLAQCVILLVLLTNLLTTFPTILQVLGSQRPFVYLLVYHCNPSAWHTVYLAKYHCRKKINRLDFRKRSYLMTYLRNINHYIIRHFLLWFMK